MKPETRTKLQSIINTFNDGVVNENEAVSKVEELFEESQTLNLEIDSNENLVIRLKLIEKEEENEES